MNEIDPSGYEKPNPNVPLPGQPITSPRPVTPIPQPITPSPRVPTPYRGGAGIPSNGNRALAGAFGSAIGDYIQERNRKQAEERQRKDAEIQRLYESGLQVAAESAIVGVAGGICPKTKHSDDKPCFPTGTPVRTPDGWRNIEEFKAGDLVLSRDEHDPSGPVLTQAIEEVFVRQGLVWKLRIGRQVIETTAEHPFYAQGPGWVACHDLKVGDLLATEVEGWRPVEELVDTGEWKLLYNFRVAEFHTYFIGTETWGFSVWTHNAYISIYKAPQRNLGAIRYAGGWGVENLIAGGNGKIYFAKDRRISDTYAYNYDQVLIEIQIDENKYNSSLKRYEGQYVGNNIHTGRDERGTELAVPVSDTQAMSVINQGNRIWHR